MSTLFSRLVVTFGPSLSPKPFFILHLGWIVVLIFIWLSIQYPNPLSQGCLAISGTIVLVHTPFEIMARSWTNKKLHHLRVLIVHHGRCRERHESKLKELRKIREKAKLQLNKADDEFKGYLSPAAPLPCE